MAEDRSWNRRSGWCLTHGRPDCKRCRWADCECPNCVEIRSKGPRLTGIRPSKNAINTVESGADRRAPAAFLAIRSEGSTDHPAKDVTGL